MLNELADHYAKLAMTKGWTEYTRHRVKELRDSSDMWKELPRMVKERIDGHKHAERTRIAESGTSRDGDIR
jgi:hypothetical protein